MTLVLYHHASNYDILDELIQGSMEEYESYKNSYYFKNSHDFKYFSLK